MSTLTTEQLNILRLAIDNNPTWSSFPIDGDGPSELATVLNNIAEPDYIVYKSTLSRHELLTGTSLSNTVFTWAGSGYTSRSQGERDAFREMWNSTGTVNPRATNIIAAITDIFSGAGGATNRTHFTEMSKRKSTYAEKILSTGGLGTIASPSTLVYEGNITASIVYQARTLQI